MAICRKCGATIMWITTSGGNRMPLDLPEDDAGNVAVRDRPIGGGFVGRVLRAGQRPLPGETVRVPHFATCPSWRGK